MTTYKAWGRSFLGVVVFALTLPAVAAGEEGKGWVSLFNGENLVNIITGYCLYGTASHGYYF